MFLIDKPMFEEVWGSIVTFVCETARSDLEIVRTVMIIVLDNVYTEIFLNAEQLVHGF